MLIGSREAFAFTIFSVLPLEQSVLNHNIINGPSLSNTAYVVTEDIGSTNSKGETLVWSYSLRGHSFVGYWTRSQARDKHPRNQTLWLPAILARDQFERTNRVRCA